MKNYSEKELAIFCGVFRLAEEGLDIKEITSRQIAAARGMGKATIYDYFSSKEELILEALVYAAAKQNRLVNRKIAKSAGFKAKMYCIYSEIINTVENSFSVFNLISYLGNLHKENDVLCRNGNVERVMEITGKTQETLLHVIREGEKEGIITPKTPDYLEMVLQGNILAVGKTRLAKTYPAETICRNAYTMLIKALG